MPNDTPNRIARAYTLTLAEAKRWARLAKLAADREQRLFAETQAANWYRQAARWEARASRREARDGR